MSYTSAEQIQAAETRDLIAFYNANNSLGKTVTKFTNRDTAEKRCIALLSELAPASKEAPAAQQPAGTPETQQEGTQDAPKASASTELATVEGAGATQEQEGAAGLNGRRAVDEIQPVKTGGRRETDAVKPETKSQQLQAAKAANVWPYHPNGTQKTTQEIRDEAAGVYPAVRAAAQAELEAQMAMDAGQDKEDGTVKASSAPKQQRRNTGTGGGNSAGVAESWRDPVTREKRLTRDGVMVKYNGSVSEHQSTRAAFKFFGLEGAKCIRFRAILKEKKTAIFEQNGEQYEFSIA